MCFQNFAGWIACLSLLAGIILKEFFIGKINEWFRAGISSITHAVWSIILFWIVLASISQHRGILEIFILLTFYSDLNKIAFMWDFIEFIFGIMQ